jgi:pimeloyl-ACP methyl ester carboxylesterase
MGKAATIEDNFFGVSTQRISSGWSDRLKVYPEYSPGALYTTSWWVGFHMLFPIRPIISILGHVVLVTAYPKMLRNTDILFVSDRSISNGTTHAQDGALHELMSAIPKNKPIRLYAHSMGTIVANKIIERYPEHKYELAVYMAAACTIHEFANSIVNYMHGEKGACLKVYSVSLHNTADLDEPLISTCGPWFGSLGIYGSLLEQLDTFVYEPLTPLDRTLGQIRNVVDNLYFFNALKPSIQKRLHFKAFPVRGKEFPRYHSDFNNFEFWQQGFYDPADATAPTPRNP